MGGRFAWGFVAVWLLALCLPGDVAANRGAPWTARGTATGDGLRLDAVVAYSGAMQGDAGGGGGTGWARIELVDPSTGLLLHRNRVPVHEDWRAALVEGCVETIHPYALESVLEPDLVFRLNGRHVHDLCRAFTQDDFFGHYLARFALDVRVCCGFPEHQ